MTVEHKDITDPNIHEPKGINSAAINTFYKANGTGGGTWAKVPTQGLAGVSGNGVANQSIIVDGSGNQVLVWQHAYGGIYFNNIGTPYTITYPSSFVKIAPTTTGFGSPKEFTEGVSGTLTYTGALTRQAEIHVGICLTQSSGADRDIRILIYKNGVAVSSSEAITGAISGSKRHLATFTSVSLSTNDYIEVYLKNDGASGDVNVHTFKISINASLS